MSRGSRPKNVGVPWLASDSQQILMLAPMIHLQGHYDYRERPVGASGNEFMYHGIVQQAEPEAVYGVYRIEILMDDRRLRGARSGASIIELLGRHSPAKTDTASQYARKHEYGRLVCLRRDVGNEIPEPAPTDSELLSDRAPDWKQASPHRMIDTRYSISCLSKHLEPENNFRRRAPEASETPTRTSVGFRLGKPSPSPSRPASSPPSTRGLLASSTPWRLKTPGARNKRNAEQSERHGNPSRPMTIETPMSASERVLLASETRIPVYRVLARRGGKKTRRMTSVMMINH
ncbi:hypothetical protein B0H13DRAFT_1900216 [Mycena leptocephala]|nr:hypothetical protein B0H13DRAFT_1900216 [Mycena leptocephala]